jgi:hypothetical protein
MKTVVITGARRGSNGLPLAAALFGTGDGLVGREASFRAAVTAELAARCEARSAEGRRV